MSKKALRQQDALEEIGAMRAQRRTDIVKCVAALAAVVALVGGKIVLEASGTVPPGNMILNGIVMMGSIGLAIYAGNASIDFTRTGHSIEYLRQKNGISRQALEDHCKTRKQSS